MIAIAGGSSYVAAGPERDSKRDSTTARVDRKIVKMRFSERTSRHAPLRMTRGAGKMPALQKYWPHGLGKGRPASTEILIAKVEAEIWRERKRDRWGGESSLRE